ncbi:dipeptidase [Pirellulimonas nuda]|uniref:dipeptidase n=1 Tax=Pirellulimonas nuda TaxID=2528009 RepID=UPI0018D2BF5E|nr:dipeptidase [Pirellulimonas nuda]
MEQVDTRLEALRDAHRGTLCELLRIPSVSADDSFRPDVQRAADWMLKHFQEMGLEAQQFETPGCPIIYAQTPAKPGAPVALVYGHYDVQPPDPLDEWVTPPFEPTQRGGNLYARGATDDKGQMLTHVLSVAATLEAMGETPIQVKFLIEGEEEVGSPNLGPFIQQQRERLACDCVVVSDSSQFAPGVPAITYGLRGIAYYEVRLTGPKQDLHSGSFGGGVTNPANVLAKLLAALVDSDGRIQVPGFYDNLVELSDAERKEFASLPFDEAEMAEQLGVNGFFGEAGYSNLERRWARPTCDINGLWSGYQGQGAKTVLPARAGAKFSFRLVPNQDPAEITRGVQALFEPLLPPGVTMELIDFHGAPGVVFPPDSPYIQAASRAIQHAFGRRPVLIREGGSIPIVGELARALDADVLLLGWGLNDDNTHSPNEKFNLEDFHRGTKASARLWQEIATLSTA